MTEREPSEVRVAVMGFLRRVRHGTLRGKVRSYEIREALNVEPLLRFGRLSFVGSTM